MTAALVVLRGLLGLVSGLLLLNRKTPVTHRVFLALRAYAAIFVASLIPDRLAGD